MKYDIAIIGGGPAGYSAAFEASKLGFKAVLFEKEHIGGTCLNRGCVPTKYLLHISDQYRCMQMSNQNGINIKSLYLDYAELTSHMCRIVSNLKNGLADELVKHNVDIVKGKAQMLGKSLVLSTGQEYEAKNILIATGSMPKNEIQNGFLTSNEILQLRVLPESVKIAGGGASAVEFAEIFNNFGVHVTIQTRGKRILKNWDREISSGITQLLKKRGVKIDTECTREQLQIYDKEVCMAATGVTPCLDGLDPSCFDIGEKGGIIVDDRYMTKTDGVYAVGDVTEESVCLAHAGMEQGRRAVRQIAGMRCTSELVTTRCIYTSPEAASAGIDETEAKRKGISFTSAKQTMYANAMTVIKSGERGFVKLLAADDTHEVIGAQFLCLHASDIVSEMALAINQKMTVEQVADSVRPHPGLNEAITEAAITLKEKLK